MAKLQAVATEAKKAFDEIRGTPEGLAKGPDGFPKQRAFRQKMNRRQAELIALSDPATKG